MSRTRWMPVGWLAAVLLAAAGGAGFAQELEGDPGEATSLQNGSEPASGDLQQSLSHWEDLIHYLRIARLDLAKSAGQALLKRDLPPAKLLKVVDQLGPYDDYKQTLLRAEKLDNKKVAQLAAKVRRAIEEARLKLAQEENRIRRAIEKLDDGLRARLNAQEQLKSAGQYAAPQLLQVLLGGSERDEALRPYAIEAMVEIGRPMVAPLSEALPELPPVPKQQAAEVLGRIGYPQALPRLKAELAKGGLQARTRRALNNAYEQIIDQTDVPRQASAAQLFLTLAEDYYAGRRGLILTPDEPHNLMWEYAPQTGLTSLKVPTPIFPDVMAMRASRRALQLDAHLSAAMSLWLAANFRRENHLPKGKEDPSYGPDMRSPRFYATLAGPRHLHPALQRAINDRNAALARDVIDALRATSGSESLLNIAGDIQPLIAAMNYPDRRVRFEAAFAIAGAMPAESFPGSQRVVPVLAEAIRGAGKPTAVAIAPDSETLNQTTTLIGNAGSYRMVVGDSIEAAAAQIGRAPTVVLTPAEQLSTAKRRLKDARGVFLANESGKQKQIVTTLQEAAAWDHGPELSDQQKLEYATTALDLLERMSMRGSPAFEPAAAQPALMVALADQRKQVALGAGRVLARFSDAESQQALAQAALDRERAEQMRVDLLRRLAASARAHGDQLTDVQIRRIKKLVAQARGKLADAAAEAHGALNLPTSRAIEFITD